MICSMELKIGGIAALTKRELNDACKDAFYYIARLWRSRYLPLHFGDRATQRYGYTKRVGSDIARMNNCHARSTYSGRKYRLIGHTRPLEYTGEGKREALSVERIRATKDRGIVSLPRKFNLRAIGSRVYMSVEIRKVRPDELRALVRSFITRLRATVRALGAHHATVSVNLLSN